MGRTVLPAQNVLRHFVTVVVPRHHKIMGVQDPNSTGIL